MNRDMNTIKGFNSNENRNFQENGNTIKKERLSEVKTSIEKALKAKSEMAELLEAYSKEINESILSHNNSKNRTMMAKVPRKDDEKSKNRETHQKNVANIAVRITKGINEALGYTAIHPGIIAIMARNHDIGHTFLGHSGEWWISNIKEDYGIGYYCHNALGPRDLIYQKDIYQEILKNIQEKHPHISDKKLKRIQNSLWIVMEGINSHNGEKSESEYVANFEKTEADFLEEVLRCHTEKGYDKKIVAGTIEANLMRLSDKISYIPYDMVDGLREGFITELNEEFIDVLEKLGIHYNDIVKKDYDEIAREMQSHLIEDVIGTTVQKAKEESNTVEDGKRKYVLISTIKMSDEKSYLMHKLRDINNKYIVDYVVLKEDYATYVPAIGQLIQNFGNLLLENDLVDKLGDIKSNPTLQNQLQEKYKHTPYQLFINFLCQIRPEEYQFSANMLKEAMKQSIKEELKIAREFILERKGLEKISEATFPRKRARIEQYIAYYNTVNLSEKLEKNPETGIMEKQMYVTRKIRDNKGSHQIVEPYTEEAIQEDVEKVFSQVQQLNKSKIRFINEQSTNTRDIYTSPKEAIALEMGARYLSMMDDQAFMQTLLDFEIIDEKQYKSLTRHYRNIDLSAEVYRDSNWNEVASKQKRETDANAEEHQYGS